MKSPHSPLSPLLQISFKNNHSSNNNQNSNMEIISPTKIPSGAVVTAEFDTSCSGKTFDADLSTRSAYRSESLRSGYCVANNGHIIKGCMKARTQRESLSRITSQAITASEQEQPLDPVPEQNTIIRFDTVEFREYPRVLSDNPSTSSGPPIGIGWKYDPKDTIALNLASYEEDREGTRRTKRELAIPPAVREDMLRDSGYSRSEITAAVKTAKKKKEQRRSSLQLLKFDPFLERVDSVKHGVQKIIPRRRSSVIGQ